MFLVNSRQSLFTEIPICSKSKSFYKSEHPLFRSYGANLPSSLASVLSRALEFSSYLPVSVYGTVTRKSRYEDFLGSVGSASLWACALPITSQGNGLPDLPKRPPYWFRPAFPIAGCAYPPASPLH